MPATLSARATVRTPPQARDHSGTRKARGEPRALVFELASELRERRDARLQLLATVGGGVTRGLPRGRCFVGLDLERLDVGVDVGERLFEDGPRRCDGVR